MSDWAVSGSVDSLTKVLRDNAGKDGEAIERGLDKLASVIEGSVDRLIAELEYTRISNGS